MVTEVKEGQGICDRCGSVQDWETEMYWQDNMGDGVFHEHIVPHEGVCDPCFFQLKEEHNRKGD